MSVAPSQLHRHWGSTVPAANQLVTAVAFNVPLQTMGVACRGCRLCRRWMLRRSFLFITDGWLLAFPAAMCKGVCLTAIQSCAASIAICSLRNRSGSQCFCSSSLQSECQGQTRAGAADRLRRQLKCRRSDFQGRL